MGMIQTLDQALRGGGGTLKLRCGACGHTAEWDQRRALQTFGLRATPYDVRHRAKCSACGAREGVEVSV